MQNEEIRDFCPLQNIIRAIKSRKMRWAGHVARDNKPLVIYRRKCEIGIKRWDKERR